MMKNVESGDKNISKSVRKRLAHQKKPSFPSAIHFRCQVIENTDKMIKVMKIYMIEYSHLEVKITKDITFTYENDDELCDMLDISISSFFKNGEYNEQKK